MADQAEEDVRSRPDESRAAEGSRESVDRMKRLASRLTCWHILAYKSDMWSWAGRRPCGMKMGYSLRAR